MRRFLYISPFFPPMTRVGALRPLKFARHLPQVSDWAPVVLCDLRPQDDADPRLERAIPETTVVIRNYSRAAQAAEANASARRDQQRRVSAKARPHTQRIGKAPAKNKRRLTLRAEDINPFGAHLFSVGHSLRAARAVLRAHPDCAAIMVNADPYAAMLVGARLANETGLPLIQDLRDPWSCCELRRKLRPPPQRRLVDLFERRAVEAASLVLLNTETARDDYRRHYADLPAERFGYLRNHGDAELIAGDADSATASPPAQLDAVFDRFSVLFMGNFRRFVEGRAVLEALAQLRAQGIGEDELQLVVTGSLPDEMRAEASALGVEGMLRRGPFTPYLDIGALMDRADLLLSFSHSTAQRIPAKVYDYLMSERPMLVVADNPELRRLMDAAGGAQSHELDDAAGIAESLRAAYQLGRGRRVERTLPPGVDSRSASAELAARLDQVTRGQPGRQPRGK